MKTLGKELPKPTYWPPLSDPHKIAAALQYVRAVDPIGNKIHQIAAIAYCATLALTTAGNGVTFAVLALIAVVRLPFTWRCYNPLLRVPTVWAVTFFVGWYALSTMWSSDSAKGLDELGTARVMALPFMLWPVIDEIIWYIGAALAGVAAQNIVQALQFFGLTSDYGHGASGRLGGWIHPIQTGAWCAAALCWHLSAILTSKARIVKVMSLGAMLLAGAGLIATGSRGPWLAAAVALPITTLLILLRRPDSRKPAAMVIITVAVGAAASYFVAPGFLQERIGGAWNEYRAASDKQEYWTSAGSRIGFWTWAIDIWKQSPVIGAGAGSYKTELDKLPQYQTALERARQSALDEMTDEDGALILDEGDDPIEAREEALREGRNRVELYLEHDHAHSSYLHTLADTGVIGLALLLLMLLVIARQIWRDPPTHWYVAGTMGVLVVWIIGAGFDTYHLSGHYFGMLALVFTATLPNRAATMEAIDTNIDSPVNSGRRQP